MAVPNRLVRKLNDMLGAEASDDMIDWMGRVEDSIRGLRQDLAEFRTHVDGRFAAIDARFASVDARFQTLEGRMEAKFAAAEAAAAQRHADFMKWTMGFWAASLITMVASIYAFARLIR